MTSTTKTATTGDETCTHNTVTHTGVPARAWKCANCGYIYGDALQPPEHDADLRDDDNGLETHDNLEVFGANYLKFPDSGIELDCVTITKEVNGEAVEVAAVYGDNQDDAWKQADRLVRCVNAHGSLIAALERTQKFLLLLTDAGVLDQIAAELSSPDEVNALCDQIDGALKHAREGE
jgi:hypothetical protein